MKMKPFVKGPPYGQASSWYNGKYQVLMYQDEKYRMLSIRREDRKAIMDWRDMQWIKNQIFGPEVEAVQLFPAESRLVDTSNQYYLFASIDPNYRFPFGFSGRAVSENISLMVENQGRSQQRPFAEYVRPPDLEQSEEEMRQFLNELGKEAL